jgi:hypothetical protein
MAATRLILAAFALAFLGGTRRVPGCNRARRASITMRINQAYEQCMMGKGWVKP